MEEEVSGGGSEWRKKEEVSGEGKKEVSGGGSEEVGVEEDAWRRM